MDIFNAVNSLLKKCMLYLPKYEWTELDGKLNKLELTICFFI